MPNEGGTIYYRLAIPKHAAAFKFLEFPVGVSSSVKVAKRLIVVIRF
jgi:hypothetical protein